MSRKTLILREDQFNEICGTNTAYLDNPGDYTEDGLTVTKTGGAVSDGNGEKEYSDPLTTDDYAHELAPETLFALLFRNGGHGLWGHWGSGLRARELTEEIDGPTNDPAGWDEQVYYGAIKIMRNFEFGPDESIDAVEHILDTYVNSSEPDRKLLNMDPAMAARYVAREAMKSVDRDYYETEVAPFMGLDKSKKKLHESNSELEGRSWNGVSYTNLTTKKTELKQLLTQLVQQNAPEKQIQRVKSALAGVCRVLDRETGAIKQRKTNRKNLGFENQFQKAGGKKNSGNGKAHSKKTKDPNVGTGYITYA